MNVSSHDPTPPTTCSLCNRAGQIISARFQQLYEQPDGLRVPLSWWECRWCRGWFVYPVPEPSVIERHWETVHYTDRRFETAIALGKMELEQRILSTLGEKIARPGTLLDIGCNFGNFLVRAREAGWMPSGFEPNGAL